MPSKKKLQFNNIIKEFGFPVVLDKISCTYKPECFDERSDLSWKMEEFEVMIDNEIEKQNSNAYTDENIDYYEQFEKIFLSHADIFDSEVYMLQLSVLLEQDQLSREKIKKLLDRTEGFDSISPEFINYLAVKDKEAINHLTQILRTRGTSTLDAMKVRQFILDLPEENVWLPSSNTRNIPSLLQTIKNRLRNTDVVLINSSKTSINVISSQVYIGNENFLKKKEDETHSRYDEASKEIDIEKKLRKLTPSDIKHIFRYENLGLELAERLYYTREEVDSNEDKTLLRENLTNRVYAQEDILDIVKNNMRYIDFDKLLLSILQVEYDEYGDTISNFSSDEALRLKELSEKVARLMVDRKTELNSDRFLDVITFDKLKDKIETLNNSYISGVYYTQEEIANLVTDYISGTRDVKTLTPHEFKNVLRFSDNEILIIIKKDPSVLGYLIENKILEDTSKREDEQDKKLFELLEKQDNIPAEQLKILYAHNKLTQSYLYYLYMNEGKVEIESINHLKENVDEIFFYGMTDVQELIDLYLSESEEDKRNFDKYRKLFKAIEIDGKSLDERNEISNKILDQSLDLLEEDKIHELYSLGLVTIDVFIDFTGHASLRKLFLSNDLKPVDARRLFYQGIIKEDMLKEIMRDPTIDEGKKITLLYSTFPDEEDTEVMQRLEQSLGEVEQNSITGSSSKNLDTRDKNAIEDTEDELKKIRIKRAYEPRAKYRLIETIDKDYEFSYNEKDGTGVFYFPNRQEYLIEKLYSKGRKPATDVATYILSKDLFEKNRHRIIQDGRVNISELYATKKSQSSGLKRLVHTGWANAIVKYYGLDDESRYSKKQIDYVKKLAKQVEDSKKEIER